MATVPDSQPTSLSQRVTTAPSNDMNVVVLRDDQPGGASPHGDDPISLARPSEDH